MGDVAVRVDGLGKRYRIGTPRADFGGMPGLRHTLEAGLRRAVRRVRGRSIDRPDGDFWALRDVSFEVKRGECIGVIGRNGAGKSTLLKVLSRITEPTTGEVRLRGRVGSLLEVGTGFHPELTGRENIYLNGSVLGMSRREVRAKFDQIVAFSEVERFLDTPVKRYSSGMYIRLAFAVAAHLDTEVLIVDEVLAVGDAQFQKKCLGAMGDATRGGRTVLLVSHNMAAVAALCQSAVLLVGGKVVYDGPADAAVRQYLALGATEQGREYVESSHGVRLIKVELVDSATGEVTTAPLFGQGYRLRVDLIFVRPLGSATLSVRVHDQLGVLVGSLNSAEEGLAPQLLVGPVRFEFDIPRLVLFPRVYTVGVCVTKPHDTTEYLSEELAAEFDVQQSVVRNGMWAYQSHSGYVRLADGVTLTTEPNVG